MAPELSIQLKASYVALSVMFGSIIEISRRILFSRRKHKYIGFRGLYKEFEKDFDKNGNTTNLKCLNEFESNLII